MPRLLLALLLNLLVLPFAVALNFTPAEEAWMAENPVIRLTFDPDSPPLEFRDQDGQYRGVSRDYVTELEKRLPIRFEIVQAADWAEAISWMEGADIDMYGMISQTPAREPYLAFTTPYIRVPSILITTATQPRTRLQEFVLDKQSVGVVRDYSIGQMAAADYPDLQLSPQDNLSQGLQQVAFGELPAMMSLQGPAAWTIQQEGITGLRAASDLGYTRQYSFGVRKDWPLLVSVLNKAIADIDVQTSQEINNRWMALTGLEQGLSRWLKILAGLLGAALLVVVLFIGWTRLLQRQVRAQTQQLQRINSTLEQQVSQRTQKLQKAYVELKVSQERLIQSEKMVSLGTMVAGLMHEVNTPLGYMVGNLSQLQQQLSTTAPQAGVNEQDWLEMVEDSLHGAQRIDQLIRSLKDYSRDHGGHQQLVDLQHCFQEARRLLSVGTRQVTLIDRTEPECYCFGDASELSQVMINLVQNAVFACEQVSDAKVILVTGGDQDMVWFEVWDNGAGIADDLRRRIFDPFFTTKPLGQGTGLGLSICQQIVRKHQGNLQLGTVLHRGSRFRVSLPRSPAVALAS